MATTQASLATNGDFFNSLLSDQQRDLLATDLNALGAVLDFWQEQVSEASPVEGYNRLVSAGLIDAKTANRTRDLDQSLSIKVGTAREWSNYDDANTMQANVWKLRQTMLTYSLLTLDLKNTAAMKSLQAH